MIMQTLKLLFFSNTLCFFFFFSLSCFVALYKASYLLLKTYSLIYLFALFIDSLPQLECNPRKAGSLPLLSTCISESESEVTQSCPILCDPMDYSLPLSSIHGIFQARVLEWVAISFSRGSSQPRDRTWVSCIVGRRFTV